MSDNARVEVDGGRELAAALDGVAGGLKDMTTTNEKVARVVAPVARRLAPRLTGRLGASVEGHGTAEGAEVGSPVTYGWPVHSGVPARNIAGVPFVADAWRDTEPVWMGVYESDVQTLVDTQVKTKAKT